MIPKPHPTCDNDAFVFPLNFSSLVHTVTPATRKTLWTIHELIDYLLFKWYIHCTCNGITDEFLRRILSYWLAFLNINLRATRRLCNLDHKVLNIRYLYSLLLSIYIYVNVFVRRNSCYRKWVTIDCFFGRNVSCLTGDSLGFISSWSRMSSLPFCFLDRDPTRSTSLVYRFIF